MLPQSVLAAIHAGVSRLPHCTILRREALHRLVPLVRRDVAIYVCGDAERQWDEFDSYLWPNSGVWLPR